MPLRKKRTDKYWKLNAEGLLRWRGQHECAGVGRGEEKLKFSACVSVCVRESGHKRANLFLMSALMAAIAGKLVRSHAPAKSCDGDAFNHSWNKARAAVFELKFRFKMM